LTRTSVSRGLTEYPISLSLSLSPSLAPGDSPWKSFLAQPPARAGKVHFARIHGYSNNFRLLSPLLLRTLANLLCRPRLLIDLRAKIRVHARLIARFHSIEEAAASRADGEIISGEINIQRFGFAGLDTSGYLLFIARCPIILRKRVIRSRLIRQRRVCSSQRSNYGLLLVRTIPVRLDHQGIASLYLDLSDRASDYGYEHQVDNYRAFIFRSLHPRASEHLSRLAQQRR